MSPRAGGKWRLTLMAAVATMLTAVSLTPVLADGGWAGPMITVVLAVAVVGGVTRQLGWPAWLTVALQVLALVLTLTVTFVSSVAILGLLPGPAAWRELQQMAHQGFTLTWNEAPPVTVTNGVALIIAGGVGIVAVTVDLLAVSLRRATIAGVPLFVLYLTPAAVLPDGVPWPLFALAGIGWVGLLLAEGSEQLSRWGRSLRTTSDDAEPLHAVGGTGRRLGATALVVAVALPMVMPSLGEGVFGAGGTDPNANRPGGSASGVRSVITVNPIIDLRRNLTQAADTEVMRYITTDTTPQYFRIATLDEFNGSSWTLERMQASVEQQAATGLPQPPGLVDAVARTPVTTDVTVTALNTPRLPLPYPVTRVDITGDWRWDAQSFDVFSAVEGATAGGISYTASSLDVEPTADQLRAAPPAGSELDAYLVLPDPTRSLLQPIVDDITHGASNDYDRALDIQNWFRTEFTYSLARAPGNNETALQSFLTDRSGYCEQFAASMGLMARVAGIPSRVQVGFTPGTRLEGQTWEVTAHDAHAWPELWFSGVGWVRFEPTPGGGDGGATPGWAPAPVSPGANSGPDGRSGPAANHGIPRLHKNPSGLPGARQLPGAAGPGGRGVGADVQGTVVEPASRSWEWYLLGVALLGGLALTAPAVAATTRRRKRWAAVSDEQGAIAAAWSDVLETATDLDLEPRATETPRDLARRLPRQGGMTIRSKEAFVELAAALERARYSRSGAVPEGVGAGSVSQHWRTVSDQVCAALFDAVNVRDRRRAKWWPTSGRRAVAAMWMQLTSSIDQRWTRVTRRA